MNVTQTASLNQVYASKLAPPTEGTRPQELGGLKVEASTEGVARSFRSKGAWDRFASRTSHGFKQFKSWFASKDQTADSAAVRFNARHEKFSGKVENLVARLARGNREDVQSGDVMATLRNDVKLMHRDAPWAARTDLLATRMDVELSKLGDEELATVADQLRQTDVSSLNAKDKADLDTMKRAVVRQQLSRSPEMGHVLGALNHASPGDVGNKATVVTRLGEARDRAGELLQTIGAKIPQGSSHDDVISGAVRMRLGRGDRGQIPGMNRNLLNLENQLLKDAANRDTSGYASGTYGFVRTLARAVRQEYLQDKVGEFQDTHLRSRMKVLGSGAAHQVTKGTYERENGVKESRVHKYDDETIGGFYAAKAVGIPLDEPRLMERSVFTAKLDHKLGFSVCVDTDFARHHDQLGIVMELAPGTTAGSVYTARGNPGVAQREMTKLQLLDCLTGQADRHRGNYMVQQNAQGEITGVKAIDSDFCMGRKPGDPEEIVGIEGVHLTHMPPVIDEDMARAIRSLTPDDIGALCGDMFDDETIAAAKSRLAAVKQHVDNLEGDGQIIRPDAWGTEEVTQTLKESFVTVDRGGKEVRESTSYWQRDYPKMEYNPFAQLMSD